MLLLLPTHEMSNESLRLYCVRSYNEPPLLHAPCFVFICSSSADFARSLFCATVSASSIGATEASPAPPRRAGLSVRIDSGSRDAAEAAHYMTLHSKVAATHWTSHVYQWVNDCRQQAPMIVDAGRTIGHHATLPTVVKVCGAGGDC